MNKPYQPIGFQNLSAGEPQTHRAVLVPKPGQAARIKALREARNDRVKAALAAAGKVIPLFRSS